MPGEYKGYIDIDRLPGGDRTFVCAGSCIDRKACEEEKQGDGKKDLLFKRVAAAREIVAPDGIDPSPLSYFVLNDAGHRQCDRRSNQEVYKRAIGRIKERR